MQTAAALSDWKDANAYRPLLQLERAGFAWEWLRRQEDYREAALQCLGLARRLPLGLRVEELAAANWGLHCFEDPDLAAPAARPIWRADHYRFVLQARSIPCRVNEDALALDRLAPVSTIASAPGGERLLLSDGFRSIRLDVRGPGLRREPVTLAYDLQGVAAAETPLLVLRRLIALVRSGDFSRSLHPPERRAQRHILLLRTLDALAAGASQREIGIDLISSAAAQKRWRVHSPTVRSQAQRLVKGARRMAEGAFWELLQ